MGKKTENRKPNYKKVSTMTFEKESKFTDNKSSNIIEVLEECARKERYSDIIYNMESQGWRFKGVSHKVYDMNNDLFYDSKLASSGYQYHSTSLEKVMTILDKYLHRNDITLEQIAIVNELRYLIQKDLNIGEKNEH